MVRQQQKDRITNLEIAGHGHRSSGPKLWARYKGTRPAAYRLRRPARKVKSMPGREWRGEGALILQAHADRSGASPFIHAGIF